MDSYRLEPATNETLIEATSIVDGWERFIDPNFEGMSSDELQMFVTGRADLVGHSLLIYPNGSTRAEGFVGLTADPARKKFWTQVAVTPDSVFMDIAVQETINQAKKVAPEWNLQPTVNNLDTQQVKAWEARGFGKVQTTYAMKKEPLSAEFAPLPVGARMRTLVTEDDWKSIHTIQHDAFENHFGFVRRPLDTFKAFRTDSATYDPSGIHILSIDGEDVGFVEVTDEIAHINQGFIQIIGVKHSHHKQGFGKLLLQWAFSYCASKGFEAVELYVDIANKSGALQFYQSAVMVAQSAYSTYENLNWAN